MKTGIMAIKNYLPQSPEMQKIMAVEEHAIKPDMFIEGEGLAIERVEDATWTDKETGEMHDQPETNEEKPETEGVHPEDIQIMKEQIAECSTMEELDRMEQETAPALVAALGEAFNARRGQLVKGAAKPAARAATGSVSDGKGGKKE